MTTPRFRTSIFLMALTLLGGLAAPALQAQGTGNGKASAKPAKTEATPSVLGPVNEKPAVFDLTPSQFCGVYGGAEEDKAVVLLIDRTTPLTPERQTKAKVAARVAMDALKSRQRLLVSTISSQQGEQRTLFDDCLPGCRFWDRATGQCDAGKVDGYAKVFHDRFWKAVGDEINLNRKDPLISAVLDTLRAVSLRFPEGGITDLVIFSDLLERGNVFGSFVKDRPMSPDEISGLLAQAREKGAVARLWETRIRVFGFGVDDELKNGRTVYLGRDIRESIRSFWIRYFTEVANATRGIEWFDGDQN